MGDEHHSILCEIRDCLQDMRNAAKIRPNIDKIEQISANNCYILDYKNRYHIFIWSATALTLTLEDLGTLSLSQYVWTNISFTSGMHIFAQGQAALIPVFVRCTDGTVQ